VITPLSGPVLNGRLYHLGSVVRDLDAAVAKYRALLGIPAFHCVDTHYPARHREWSGTIANRNAFGKLGDLVIELVEPGTGEGPAMEYLRARGEGLFHVGYATEDPTQQPGGVAPCFEVRSSLLPDGNYGVVYLDTLEQLGFFIELVHTPRAQRVIARTDDFLATTRPLPGLLGGRLYHVGVVVRDLDAAIAKYRVLLGVPAFHRVDARYLARYRDWTGVIEQRIAHGKWGDLLIELIETRSGNGPHLDYLETRGEGMFHLGYATEDPTQRPGGVAACYEVLPAQRPNGDYGTVYLDTLDELGFFVELVHSPRAERIIATAEHAASKRS
jgi:methylmalonyl-CoA/ethylmalonyl-CoA epimerase